VQIFLFGENKDSYFSKANGKRQPDRLYQELGVATLNPQASTLNHKPFFLKNICISYCKSLSLPRILPFLSYASLKRQAFLRIYQTDTKNKKKAK